MAPFETQRSFVYVTVHPVSSWN